MANEKDFDSTTGELKVTDKATAEKNKEKNNEKNKLVVLNEDITHSLMQWLRGLNNTHSSTNNVTFQVTDIDVRKLTRKPPVPFITSSLQQEASKKHHFSPQRTMALAQMLYEKGYITYMRTDSVNLSGLAIGTAKTEIIGQYGEQYHKVRQYTTKTKGAQEAHEAIRPTDFKRTPASVRR